MLRIISGSERSYNIICILLGFACSNYLHHILQKWVCFTDWYYTLPLFSESTIYLDFIFLCDVSLIKTYTFIYFSKYYQQISKSNNSYRLLFYAYFYLQ